MKRLYTFLVAIVLCGIVWAQVPQKISYQGILRDSNNELVKDRTVSMRITILENSPTGTPIYREKQEPGTNENGLVSIEIGAGVIVIGDFNTIPWNKGPFYLKAETDIEGGNNYTITATSQIISAPYALHSRTTDSIAEKTIKNYAVGDFAQGGIVFYVDESGQHGLVCTKEDINEGNDLRWYAEFNGYGETKARGEGPFAGEMNTSIIIAAHLSIGDDNDNYAARECVELVIIENGYTYGDWYLPSSHELDLMYQNILKIEETALDHDGTEFYEGYYWSSTEVDELRASVIDFSSGLKDQESKSTPCRIRAVRAF